MSATELSFILPAMPDIPPASAISSAAPVGGAASGAAAGGGNIVVETTVNSAPDKIRQLARQIEVTGTLAQPPAGNTITLATLIGPLTLLLPHLAHMQQEKLVQQLIQLFETQKPITVVVQPGNPPSQALLLLPPPVAQNQAGSAHPYLSAGQAQRVAAPMPPLTAAITLSAIVLPKGIEVPPASLHADALAHPVQVAGYGPGGTGRPVTADTPAKLQMPIVTMPPQADSRHAAPAPVTGGMNAAVPVANAAAVPASVAPHIAAMLQPGAELNLRVVSLIPPGTPPAALPVLPDNQIIATVTGNAPGGQLILKAGDATLFVRQPLDAPPGTQLVLTVDPAQPHVPVFMTTSDLPQFMALQQIIAQLAQADPAGAHAMLASRLPQPGEGLAGALLFFLSAVKQGDVRGWLGGGAHDVLMRGGKSQLLGRLAEEMQQAAQSSRDNVVGEWRSYPVPFYDNNHLGVIYLHVHGGRERQAQEQDGGKDGKPASQVRFVIDVRMSHLGALQLDGFLRAKQLDIIIRSENNLPADLANTLRGSYSRIMEAIGYTGGLGFHAGRPGWLHIQNPAAGAVITT
ncbi:MAG: hypothetical protein AB7H77_01575 [Bdellovibrionales bacterium]